MKKVRKRLVGMALVLALVFSVIPSGPGRLPAMAAETESTAVAAPVFSHESGNYQDAFDLTLSAEEGTMIYYSTDGSDPFPEKIGGEEADPDPLTSEICEIPVDYDKVSIPDRASYSTSEDGIVIEPSARYHNVSFSIPEKYKKIAQVNTLHVLARIDEISAPESGNGVELQTAVVREGATHSYQEEDGSYTRLSDSERSIPVVYSADGEFVDYTFEPNIYDMSSAGFVMIGAGKETSTGGYITKMTVQRIYFTIDLDRQNHVENGHQALVFPYDKGEKISIHDRTGEPNVLATESNSNKFAQLKSYTASDDDVAKSTVIRAMAVDAAGNRSPVVTKTYFVGQNLTTRYSGVPVFSMVTDPENLTDDERGIFVTGNHVNYSQSGREWEREAYIDFYDDDGTIDFSSNIGIRVHGGYTRQYPQKSLNIYFREEYGQKNLKYELIPGASNHEGTGKTTKYKKFMLRNGGNDSLLTKLRDVYIQSRVADRHMSVQSSRPCILYLNGEYWGLYNIQEKYSDNWVEEEFGVDKDNVVVIKNGEVDEGTDADMALFEDLESLAALDMSQTVNYRKFLDAVDLSSYLDYYATEILIGNNDWNIHQNNQCWRSRSVTSNKYEDGKWRWMLFDTEYSMNLYGSDSGDTIENLKGGLDPLFEAVLQNAEFRQAFASTAMDLLNENFNYTRHFPDYEKVKAIYETLMVEQNRRFGNDWGGDSMDAFERSTKQFENAWADMRSRVEGMLIKHCSVTAPVTVSVSTNLEVPASLSINSLTESVDSVAGWSGTYFKEYPLPIAAPAVGGYTFKNWQISGGTAADATAAVTSVSLKEDTVTVKAVYVRDNGQIIPPPATVKPAETIEPVGTSTPPAVTKPSGTAAPQGATDLPQTVKVILPGKAVIKRVRSKKKRTAVIVIKKLKADGFQVVYARNKKFTKNKKKKRTRKQTVTLKKLKRGTTCYIKVRAYRKAADGTVYYGRFSKIKRVKVK